mmetsp:Transcript_48899/g.96761  ORF Transcript_48899/g.96761 Transcript_48899/m.96761 type:complete len:369 (+) Transcript_48899:210-1316(+)
MTSFESSPLCSLGAYPQGRSNTASPPTIHQSFLNLDVVNVLTATPHPHFVARERKRTWSDDVKDDQSPRSIADRHCPARAPPLKKTATKKEKYEKEVSPPSTLSQDPSFAVTTCPLSAAAPHQIPFDKEARQPVRVIDDLPAPVPLVSTEGRRVLVLDNDETTGYFQLASLLYGMHLHLTNSPPPRSVVCGLLRSGALRPGAIELLRLGTQLKAEQRLDHLIVFTAASDSSGWVTYLVGCLEEVSGIPAGSIDVVLSRKHATAVHPATGHLVKDLRRVCGDSSRCCIVDDKPHMVAPHGGHVIAVRPYEQHTPIEELIEQIPCCAEGKKLARAALREDNLANKPPSALDFSNDTELFDLLPSIKALFP